MKLNTEVFIKPLSQLIQEVFSVPNIAYDVMGNITELERRGTVAVQGSTLTNGLLDKLTYRYQGNQLQAVQDAGQSSKGFVDGAASNQEYHYDVNGNVTKDDNKQIAIVYNHLNLPKRINFAQNNARIDWLYTATGQKVQKKVTAPNNTVTYKHYIGKVQYLGAELEFIQHQEGRIVRKLTGVATNNEPIYAYSYEYCLKDHLGNSRVFFSDLDNNGVVEVTQGGSVNELLQQAHYYPFGMRIEGQWGYVQPQVGNGNAYLYNGKELNADFGLGWSDYGARWYDASIGRWNGVDPLAERYSQWSGYNYVMGNPLKFVDPDGMRVVPPDDIYVDRSGKVVERIENEQPDRLFIGSSSNPNSREITLNDPARDRIQLGGASVGDQLVHFLSVENQHFLISKGKSFPLLSDIPALSEAWGVFSAATMSTGGTRDFGYTWLVPQLSVESLDNSNYDAPLLDARYQEWDVSGGLIFFEGAGRFKTYNVPDAGNFLWGAAIHASNVTFTAAVIGSTMNDNEDTGADQQAIFEGYNQYGRISNPIGEWIPSWLGGSYIKTAPSFWRSPEQIQEVLDENGF